MSYRFRVCLYNKQTQEVEKEFQLLGNNETSDIIWQFLKKEGCQMNEDGIFGVEYDEERLIDTPFEIDPIVLLDLMCKHAENVYTNLVARNVNPISDEYPWCIPEREKEPRDYFSLWFHCLAFISNLKVFAPINYVYWARENGIFKRNEDFSNVELDEDFDHSKYYIGVQGY